MSLQSISSATTDRQDLIQLLGMPEPPRASACKRAPVVLFGHPGDPSRNSAGRVACGCNSCDPCLRRKTHLRCVRAATKIEDAVAEGSVIAVATVRADDNGRGADAKARKRAGSTGAITCVCVDTLGMMFVVARFPAGARLPKPYQKATAAEACQLLGRHARELRRTARPTDGRRGIELIGLKGDWALSSDPPTKEKVVRITHLRMKGIETILGVLERLGLTPKVRRRGDGWAVTWKYPPDWTQEAIAQALREIVSSADRPGCPRKPEAKKIPKPQPDNMASLA